MNFFAQQIIFTPRAGSVTEKAIYPTRHNYRAAGIDLYAPHDVTLAAFERKAIPTAFDILIPEGHFAQVVDCSSFPLHYGGHVLAGIIDQDYQGEVFVLLYNTTPSDLYIPKRTKIAQILLHPSLTPSPVVMSKFMRGLLTVSTERGPRGFGYDDTSTLVPQVDPACSNWETRDGSTTSQHGDAGQ